MTTDNALAGGDAVSAPVDESTTTAPAAEQAQTDAQTNVEGQTQEQTAEGAEKSGESDAAKNTDKGKTEEPRKSRRDERIDRLTRDKYDAERRAEALAKEVDRLRKPLPSRADMTEDERSALANRQAVRDELGDQAEERAKAASEQAHRTRKQIFEAKVDAIKDRAPEALAKFYAVPCSSMMADYIGESEKAGEIAVFLGSNPDEAMRIRDLPPARQAIELAKLEGRLQAAPEVRRISQAPAPTDTRLKGGSNPPAFDAKKAPVGDVQEMLRKAGVIS